MRLHARGIRKAPLQLPPELGGKLASVGHRHACAAHHKIDAIALQGKVVL